MTTIPASAIVEVIPNILNAGGDALIMNGMVLSGSTRVPIGVVQPFDNAQDVADYFGPESIEANIATIYFQGYINCTQLPATILYAQYNQAAVAAYLRGGPIDTVPLATLQTYSGSLTVVMDGYTHTASSINLSSATSYSAAAALIQTGLTASEPTEASFTGSMGATFTGTGSGTNLTVSGVTGFISPGDAISGTGVPANTKIVSQTSGTPGGTGLYVTNNATTSSSATITSSSNVLDVTNVSSGTLSIGQTVTGASVAAGSVVVGLGTGSGLTGTYTISGAQQSIASESMTAVATAVTVTYDSVSGAFIIMSGITGTPSTAAYATGTLAAELLLTQNTGALLSQGAAAATPSAFMNSITLLTQNWADFMTAFDPDQTQFIGLISGTSLTVSSVSFGTLAIGQPVYGHGVALGTVITAGSGLSWTVSVSQTVASTAMFSPVAGGGNGNANKLLFAEWVSSTNKRYAYICWDTDVVPTEEAPATESLGYQLAEAELDGTCLIWGPDYTKAAFVCGTIASINFQATNGRITFAFKGQAGLTPDVTDETTASNLIANGYNFYGAYATADQQFLWFYPGSVSGEFEWLDSYVNQIWLNNALQLALMELLNQVNSLPYNAAGYALVEAACADPINNALNFGAIAPGVPLSVAQAAEVNNSAGSNIAPTLSSRGWYLQVLPAQPQVRQARQSPPCNLWYMDGESIQRIVLNSVDVQ